MFILETVSNNPTQHRMTLRDFLTKDNDWISYFTFYGNAMLEDLSLNCLIRPSMYDRGSCMESVSLSKYP